MSDFVYVAGASSRARTAKEYLEYIYPDLKVRAFLVSPEMTDNESVVDGVPVTAISGDADVDRTSKVYIGTRGANHEKLKRELCAIGFDTNSIIPVSVDLDIKLRNEYVRRKFEEDGRSFVKFDEIGSVSQCETAVRKSVRIYEASSAFDGELSDPYIPLEEEKILQVGAVLTDKKIDGAVAFDDKGNSISDRNKQFCELTGLYWIWKNATEDIVGLVHYRRHFLLPRDWADVFLRSGVDVILPVPLYVAPSIEENYRTRHVTSDWDNMKEYLRDNYPEDHDRACEFFKGGFYSPCNMLITRKPVLDDLCDWMFPILFDVAQKGGERDDKYQNRYPGFLSERLMTYFFESRRDKYKIVYADKNFLN